MDSLKHSNLIPSKREDCASIVSPLSVDTHFSFSESLLGELILCQFDLLHIFDFLDGEEDFLKQSEELFDFFSPSLYKSEFCNKTQYFL